MMNWKRPATLQLNIPDGTQISSEHQFLNHGSKQSSQSVGSRKEIHASSTKKIDIFFKSIG